MDRRQLLQALLSLPAMPLVRALKRRMGGHYWLGPTRIVMPADYWSRVRILPPNPGLPTGASRDEGYR